MYGQKFAIGEIVGMALNSLPSPKTQDLFRILARYITLGKSPIYRIQNLLDRGERMVSEAELLQRYAGASAAPKSCDILRLHPMGILRFRLIEKP
ncbi:hypothetical protein [Kaistia terrae]|uniref:Uncharacterized protein n=1 Tax=Kaistia terrae TaxID=537017 RepID=A0ABW0PXL5_9HYPH|nr:hypothetical protein [Kaistia terrae]MCX5581767.1 hypothetical protein [Kaistia terrae]